MFSPPFDPSVRYVLRLLALAAALLAVESGIRGAERPARADRHGDPLPDGALARLGTVRWRHGWLIYDLAYSPDGKKIATVGLGRSITVWDAATGKLIYQIRDRDFCRAVAFSPDGKILATADRSICQLWDAATGKELRQFEGHTQRLNGIAFAPDGKTLATAGSDDTARIWEASTGKELRRLDCRQEQVHATAYSPDGKLLATAGKDGTIRLWDADSGTKRRQLNAHKKTIHKLVFSPDGKRLASSSEDGTIRLWEPATGRQVHVIEANLDRSSGFAWPIAFSPDSALLALGSWEDGGMIRLWDMESGTERRRWQAGINSVVAIAFSPQGKTLAASAVEDGSIRLWDAATGKEKHPSDAHHGFVDLLRFSEDGTSLFSVGRERRLLRWDLTANTPAQQFSWTTKQYSSFALSPDGKTLAANGWPDAHLRLWDVRTGKPGRILGKPRQEGFWQIVFSPDGRLLASEGDDRAIHVWNARDGREIQKISGYKHRLGRLRFSPDSKALAGSFDGRPNASAAEPTLRLWEVESGKELAHFDSHEPMGFALAFSPDGKVLAAGSVIYEGGSIRLWGVADGKELCRHTGHREGIASIAFSPDGKLAASGTGNSGYLDGSVHVWEAATGRLIRHFEGHHSAVMSVAFSPNGLTLASGAGDSTILLWDITGRRSDGRWHAKPLTPSQLDACWMALANEDAAKAYDAVWSLVAASEQAAPFLRKHLPPAPHPDAKTVARSIADLDSDEFMVRQKATEELSRLGDAIAPALRRALDGKPVLEVRRRLQQLLDQTRDWTPQRLRHHRAIQALEHLNTMQARQVLQALAEGAPQARRTEEAKAVLQRLPR